MKFFKDKLSKTIIYVFILILVGTINLSEDSSMRETKYESFMTSMLSTKPEQTIEVPIEIQSQVLLVEPLSERELIDSYIVAICSKYNIDPAFIKSVIQSESEYDPNSKTGDCLGLMQVSRYWHTDRAERLGVTDFYDPYSNILLGVDYLSELFDKYKDPRLVLMLYNMDHNTAFKLYAKGTISTYAKTVISKAEEYRKGV